MPVVLVMEGVTQEQYEESVRKLTAGKERLESQEALDAFAAKLMPILEEIGVQGPPEVYPAHTYVSA